MLLYVADCYNKLNLNGFGKNLHFMCINDDRVRVQVVVKVHVVYQMRGGLSMT